MDICCAFVPVPDTPEHAALADRLGYRRAWVYDGRPLTVLGLRRDEGI